MIPVRMDVFPANWTWTSLTPSRFELLPPSLSMKKPRTADGYFEPNSLRRSETNCVPRPFQKKPRNNTPWYGADSGSTRVPSTSVSAGTRLLKSSSPPFTETNAMMENVRADTVSVVSNVRSGRFFKFDTPIESAVLSELASVMVSSSTSPPARRARRSRTSNRA
jgi:hypothetical protein